MTFNYPAAWKKFWELHLGGHSLLRCPGSPCPGGCGANAKDDLAELVDRERERKRKLRLERKANKTPTSDPGGPVG